ncbi:uncharacterized protein LOC124830194 isoform X1 [Vigna umbellata]|uniref:uncharacterized protein LOC124830194 isoform X1 n=1 Tax=Vigna umbellata TaxID=87088 RepID=UPI001F5F20B4|nr:uncharacterized protein LOC124830194 isoform X1 [Vigna umbellata]
MMPEQWVSPCGNQCTNKYSALTQIPWRVFCKKGCSSEEETWEECLEYCNLMCYKDPVLKDQQWSAYIDRSPGAASYSAIWEANIFQNILCSLCIICPHLLTVTENSVPLILSVHVPVYKMISLWNVFMLVYLVAVTSLT